jgi:hypothetical protein
MNSSSPAGIAEGVKTKETVPPAARDQALRAAFPC